MLAKRNMKPKKKLGIKVFLIAIFIIGLIFAATIFTLQLIQNKNLESKQASNPSGSSVTTSEDHNLTSKEDSSLIESNQQSEDQSSVSEKENVKDETNSDTETENTPDTETNNASASISVDAIWAGMRNNMGEDFTANLCLSKENLSSLYGLDPKVCESFVLYKAGTVVSPEEYFIVKSSSANLTVIEQACQQRQAALAEQWADYKDFKTMIDEYQIARSGEYLFFGISSHINQLVGIFQGIMMTQN